MTNMTVQLLLTLLLIQHHIGTGLLLFWGMQTIGRLEKDADYNLFYVGENLTLHCTKFTDFTGTLRFMYGNVNVGDKFVTRVNKTYARMDKPITSEDFGVTVYQCSDDAGLIDSIGSIYAEYPPQNATGLQMVWLNKARLGVSWSFGNTLFKNKHLVKVNNITAEWSSSSVNDSTWQLCYHGNLLNSSCEPWAYRNQWDSVVVRINFTNEIRNDIVTTVFPSMRVREHAKPDPVKDVKVVALNSTTARVTIEIADDEWETLNFSITYYVMGNQDHSVTKVTGLTTNRTFDILELHPHCTYQFDVRARFELGYLSELPDVNATVLMPEAAPSSAPVVMPGSYHLDPFGCLQKNETEGYIYYQEVPEDDRNGDIKHYTAEVRTHDWTQTFDQPNLPRTLKLASVPCKAGFNVSVYASTVAGRSPSTLLRVPGRDPELVKIVERLKLRIRAEASGAITAEWDSPGSDQLSIFLYYCTKNGVDHNMCHDSIHRVSIDPQKGWHSLPLADGNMKFGVAAVRADGVTMGITFTNCIYDPAREPGSPPVLRALPQTDHIVLNWKGRECDDSNRVLILNYEIRVCRVAQKDCQNYIADGSESTFNVKNVVMNTNYSMEIRANTTSSLTPFSEPVHAMIQPPATKGLSSQEIGGITGGVLVLAIFFGVLLVCFCRDRFKAMKAKFGQNFNVPAPPPQEESKEAFNDLGSIKPLGITNNGFVFVNGNNDAQHKNTQPQNSGNSGYESGNSPLPSPATEQASPPDYSKLAASIRSTDDPIESQMPAADTPGVDVPHNVNFAAVADTFFVLQDPAGSVMQLDDLRGREFTFSGPLAAEQPSGYVQCTEGLQPSSAGDQIVEHTSGVHAAEQSSGNVKCIEGLQPPYSAQAVEQSPGVRATKQPSGYVRCTDGLQLPSAGQAIEQASGVQAVKQPSGYVRCTTGSTGDQITEQTSSGVQAAKQPSGYVQHTERLQPPSSGQAVEQTSGVQAAKQPSGYVQCSAEWDPPSSGQAIEHEINCEQDPPHPVTNTIFRASVPSDNGPALTCLSGEDGEEDTVLQTSIPGSSCASGYVQVCPGSSLDQIMGSADEEEPSGNPGPVSEGIMNPAYVAHDLTSGPQPGLKAHQTHAEGGRGPVLPDCQPEKRAAAVAGSGYLPHPSASTSIPQPATGFEQAMEGSPAGDEEDLDEEEDCESISQQAQPQQAAAAFTGYLPLPSAHAAVPQPSPGEAVKECHVPHEDCNPDPVFQGAGEGNLPQAAQSTAYAPNSVLSSAIPQRVSRPPVTPSESRKTSAGEAEEGDYELADEADDEKSSSGASSLSEGDQSLNSNGYVAVETAQVMSPTSGDENGRCDPVLEGGQSLNSNGYVTVQTAQATSPAYLNSNGYVTVQTARAMSPASDNKNGKGDHGEALPLARMDSGYCSPPPAKHSKHPWLENGSTGNIRNHRDVQ